MQAVKKHVSMPDLKSVQTSQEDKKSKESGHGSRLRSTYKTVMRGVSPDRNRGEVGRQQNSYEVFSIMCLKNSVIQAKTIDIKLPCLDTNRES